MASSMGPPPPKNPNTTAAEPQTKTLDEASPSGPMTTPMGPPPPKNSQPPQPDDSIQSQTKTLDEASPSGPMTTPMGPPPPQNSQPPQPDDSIQSQTTVNHEESQSNPPQNDSNPTEDATDKSSTINKDKQEQSPNMSVPYTIPSWNGSPCHHFFLEILKDGFIIDQFDVNEKGAYMFGRVDLCDFILDHPTISRFHAVLQFKSSGDAYLYDLGSTHGTFINKKQVKKRVYVELHVGDVIRFGHSSRLYIFQGPSDLMPPEGDLKRMRNVKIHEEMQDMEASLLRAKREASLVDGISWGMGEDAIEETEDDNDEVTWQTYKGQLTERQEKTRDKVLKRLEKIAHMKKEIDAIRSKDIAQGGLTQGQQTQIARNEQRISQLMEELENLEETLNESIRESMGARAGRMSHGKKKGATEDDEDDCLSDDDEFYDRAKKPSQSKVTKNQSVETADSLLDKKYAIIKEMEDKRKLLLDEEGRMVSEKEVVAEAGDALDAYMTGLSSQLVLVKTEKLKKELSTLQSELDRVLYLLKIADPSGEAARKRESKSQEPKPDISKIHASAVVKRPPIEHERTCGAEQIMGGSIQKKGTVHATKESNEKLEEHGIVVDATDVKTIVYSVAKPQWLGAIGDKEMKNTQQEAAPLNVPEDDQFVDYKDRKMILEKSDTTQMDEESGLENAAPGLIIRKRKSNEKSDVSEVKSSKESTCSSVGAEIRAEDAVALLLKHTKGYYASDEEVRLDSSEDTVHGNQSGKDNKKAKRVLGPEKPSFLESECEPWVPPEGQSGDGWTSLNDRYGY